MLNLEETEYKHALPTPPAQVGLAHPIDSSLATMSE